MDLDEAVIGFEAADKDLARTNPVRLTQFLLACRHLAEAYGKKNLIVGCPHDSSVRFIVKGKRVCREVHQFDNLYTEEYLKEIFPGIEEYMIETTLKFKNI